jgi:tripartite-type tricarboxylate transporter receptor subunit TctC
VVGFAAGGGVDIVARQLGERLSAQLGQRIIVLNKPGAGGNLAAEAVAQAEPDGYTLLAANLGILSINPYLYERKAFDPNKDFVHLARTVVTPLMAAVPKASPARTLADFVALAKTKPGALNYGSGGIGNINHLAVELFASRAGIKMQHLPFRGSAPALNEMVAGRIDLIIDGINLVQPFVDSGDVRPLAVTSAERASSAPSIPTAQEAGIGDFVVLGWQGISAPAATPAAVRERLEKEIKAALDNPALNQLLLKQGTAPAYLGSADFTRFIAAEQQRWKAVITETGAQVK